MAAVEIVEEVEAKEEEVSREARPAPLVVTDRLDLPTLGKLLVASGYFTDTTSAAKALVKVIAGRDIGIGPVAAMNNIFIVQNRLAMGYALVGAMIKRSLRYDYRVKSLTKDGCVLTFLQKVDGVWVEVGESSFTKEDADLAGLRRRGGAWQTYPRNMYFARALTNGARMYCPDVFLGGVYDPDELD